MSSIEVPLEISTTLAISVHDLPFRRKFCVTMQRFIAKDLGTPNYNEIQERHLLVNLCNNYYALCHAIYVFYIAVNCIYILYTGPQGGYSLFITGPDNK